MAEQASTHVNNWKPEQIRFIRWLALPKAERQPKTQKLLAEEIEVSEKTLCDWKHLPGFRDAVREQARDYIKDDVPDVLATIRKKAKEGSQYHTNLFLAMAGMAPDVAAGNPQPTIKVLYGHTGFNPDDA